MLPQNLRSISRIKNVLDGRTAKTLLHVSVVDG